MLYLVTNRRMVRGKNFLSVIEEAVKGGVDAVILREKDLPTAELLPVAKEVNDFLKQENVLLIINGNLQVAKAVNAGGFHTRFTGFIKENPKFSGLLGVSVHDPNEAVLAEKHGASYLLAGHIFATSSKKKLVPRGTELIKAIKTQVNIPVVAIGGIKPENVEEVLAAGADGIAAMSFVMQAPDPRAAAKMLKEKILRFNPHN